MATKVEPTCIMLLVLNFTDDREAKSPEIHEEFWQGGVAYSLPSLRSPDKRDVFELYTLHQRFCSRECNQKKISRHKIQCKYEHVPLPATPPFNVYVSRSVGGNTEGVIVVPPLPPTPTTADTKVCTLPPILCKQRPLFIQRCLCDRAQLW